VARWSRRIAPGDAAPAVVAPDGTVIVTITHRGPRPWVAVHAVRPTGATRWSWRLERQMADPPPPVVGRDGTVYLTTWDAAHAGELRAVSAGKPRWTAALGAGHPSAPLVLSDGTILVASGTTLRAFDGAGRAAGESTSAGLDLDLPGRPAPALGERWLYVPAASVVAAFPPAGGAMAWGRRLAGCDRIRLSPAVADDGTLAVVCGGHASSSAKLYRLHADGSEAWKWGGWATRVSPTTAPALGRSGTIYVAGPRDVGPGHVLYAVSPDGTVAWTYDLDAEPSGAPVVDGADTVYVPSASGVLHAVGPDGQRRFALALARSALRSPAVARDGSLFVTSAAGDLVSVGAAPR
jgi:outer membrane protein assembly factor BamB